MNLEAVRDYQFPVLQYRYTAKDTCLYALSVGAGESPQDSNRGDVAGCTSWYLHATGIPNTWPWDYATCAQAMTAPNLEDFNLQS
jgi:hypothetical protein